jgi:energy-coupling factor transporter ATP-binding protein EcfA2
MTDVDLPVLRVDALTVRNYRGFEALDMELHPEVTVLFGENGAGKSNVLAALATLLSGLWQKAPHNIEPGDAYEPTGFGAFMRHGRYPVSLNARVVLRGGVIEHGRDPNSIYVDQHVPLRPTWARARLEEIVKLIDADQREEALSRDPGTGPNTVTTPAA